MRIADVVHAASVGRACLVDANQTEFALSRYLSSSEGLPVTTLEEWVRTGPAVVLTVMDSLAGEHTLTHLREVVAHVRLGDAIAIFVDASLVTELGRIVAELTNADLQISRVVPLAYRQLTAAVVASPTPVRPVGLPSDSTPPEAPTDWNRERAFLRVANEYTHLSFHYRVLRERAALWQKDLERTRSHLEASQRTSRELPNLQRQVTSLEEELSGTKTRLDALKADLARATERLEAVHESTTWQVGRVMTDVARNPERAFAASKKLMRLWRNRGHRPERVDHDSAEEGMAGTDARGAHLLARLWRQVGTSGRMTIGGPIGDELARDLRMAGIDVVQVLPHDPDWACEGVDIFLLDGAEFGPTGRWYGAAQTGWAHRDIALVTLVDRAVSAEIPVVFALGDSVLPPPGLSSVAPTALHLPAKARAVFPLEDRRLLAVGTAARSDVVPLLFRGNTEAVSQRWTHGPTIDLSRDPVDLVELGLRSRCVVVPAPTDADVSRVIAPLVVSGSVVVTDRTDLDHPGVVVRPALQPVEETLDRRRVLASWTHWHRHQSPDQLLLELTSLVGSAPPAKSPIGLLAYDDESGRSAVIRARTHLRGVVVVGGHGREDAELEEAGLEVQLVEDWCETPSVVPQEALVWLPAEVSPETLNAAAAVTGADVVVGGGNFEVTTQTMRSPKGVLTRRGFVRFDREGPSLHPVPRFHVPAKEN